MGQEVKLGLRLRIVLLAAGTMLLGGAAALLVAGLVFTSSYADALQSGAMAGARGMVLQLDRLLGLGIKVDQITGFEEQCREAVSAAGGNAFAFVASPDGRLLFHSDSQRIGGTLKAPEVLAAIQDRQHVQIEANGDFEQSYLSLVPVVDHAGAHIATAAVGIPKAMVTGKRDAIVRHAALAGGFILALGVAVFLWALSRYVTDPISKFVSTIARIRRDPDGQHLRAAKTSDDELGVLIDGFNGLLDDIDRREEQLTRARDEAAAANRAKTAFLATMSHELRTPLHAVLGMSDLLFRTGLSPKQERYVRNAKLAGKSLLAIIEDILDFSRIEAGRLDLSCIDFDPARCVREVTAVLGESAREKGLSLSASVAPNAPALVHGDPKRFTQILTNLVGNAVKFTDLGGVEVTLTGDGPATMTVRITDTGIGMDADTVARVFEPFIQGDGSSSRRHGGTGLGLSIVRQIVAAMGGTIAVTSKPGVGSIFEVSLPTRVTGPHVVVAAHASSQSAPRVTAANGHGETSSALGAGS